jgi:anti-anti-sigma factor
VIFDVRAQQEGTWTVLRVVGDVDLANLPALKQQADLVLEGDLALDLRSATSWDPVTFGVVVAAALRVRRRGRRFAVLLSPGRVRELFAESRIDRIVEVRASLSDREAPQGRTDPRDQDE